MTSVEEMSGVQSVDDSLVFCNLPQRKSVSCWEEPSRMSYYNVNERLAVPFKWEAAPGKPMVDEFQPGSPESGAASARLRPPPAAAAAGGRLSRRWSGEFDRLAASSTSPLTGISQRSRLPPKNRSFSRPQLAISMSNNNTAGADNPGQRRVNRSKESISKRSDFDWPEVSDDECSSRPADDQEPPSSTTAAAVKEELSFSSSSFSSNSNSDSPSSANSVGGSSIASESSARELVLLRNLVNIAAAASPATPSKSPVQIRGDGSFSEEDEENEENEDDHVRPSRGFLSCMPIFSRMRVIQSQLSKTEKNVPAMIDFSNRLTPGLKNKLYSRQSL